jgi:hypothetical protein
MHATRQASRLLSTIYASVAIPLLRRSKDAQDLANRLILCFVECMRILKTSEHLVAQPSRKGSKDTRIRVALTQKYV